MNQDRKIDFYKINQKLKARRWKKHLNILWALLIIPVGFACFLVAKHSSFEPDRRPVSLASPGFPVPMKRPATAPIHPVAMTRQPIHGRAAPTKKAKRQVPRSTRKHARAKKKPAAAPKKSAQTSSSIAVGAAPGLVKE